MLFTLHNFMLLVCKDTHGGKFARLHESFLHVAWPRFARARLHGVCIQGFKLLLVRLRLTTK